MRVLARHPEKARQAFADAPPSQIEFGTLEFGKRPTYLNAFDGLDKLFVLRPPAVSQVSKDMFPALDVALGAGVRHFVLLSLKGPTGCRSRRTRNWKNTSAATVRPTPFCVPASSCRT